MERSANPSSFETEGRTSETFRICGTSSAGTGSPVSWRVVGVTLLGSLIATAASAQLTPLALYHLGEEEGGVVGANVTSTPESLGITLDKDMVTTGFGDDITYSDDVPSYISGNSNRSVEFGFSEQYLATTATNWFNQYPGFRMGFEAFIKVDPALEGINAIPWSNGSSFNLTINADLLTGESYYSFNGTGPATTTPVAFGEWQHVAWMTTGSFWNIYIDGVDQFGFGPNFTYGGTGGEATLGNNNGGGFDTFQGLIDEHRVFTWTGAYDPSESLWWTLRTLADGDVNDDGTVNQIDYNIWRTNVGIDIGDLTLLEGGALGDVNGDGEINLDDFAIIKANVADGVTLVVPEPSTCLLLLAGVLASAAFRRRSRAALKLVAIAATLCLLLQPADLVAQTAVWGGGDGNWTDANWSGGTGVGGAPGAGDAVVLPNTTGTISVSGNTLPQYGQLQHKGGILTITSSGVLDFSGAVQTGLNPDAVAGTVINLSGELLVGGGFNVGFDVAPSTLRVNGGSILRVNNDLDTWWADGANLQVTGSGADVEIGGTFYLGTGATMQVNLDSSAFSTFFVPGTVNFPGGAGTLDVNFVNDYEPVIGDSWTLFDAATQVGAIPIVDAPDLGPGYVLAVGYEEGGNFGQARYAERRQHAQSAGRPL